LFKINAAELRGLGLVPDEATDPKECVTHTLGAADFNRLLERAEVVAPGEMLTGTAVSGGRGEPVRVSADSGRKTRAVVVLLSDSVKVTTQNSQTAKLSFVQAGKVTSGGAKLGFSSAPDLGMECELTPVWTAGRIDLSMAAKITEIGGLKPTADGNLQLGPRSAGKDDNLPIKADEPKSAVSFSPNAVAYVNRTLGPVKATLESGQTLLVLAPSDPGVKGAERLLISTTATAVTRNKDSEGAASDPLPGVPPSSATAAVTRVFETSRQDLVNSVVARWRHPAVPGMVGRGESELLRSYFEMAPPGAGPLELLQHDRAAGRLQVKGTPAQLDIVERKLNTQLLLMTRTFHVGTNDLGQLIRARWQYSGAAPEVPGQGEAELLRAYFLSANPQAGSLDAIWYERAKGQLLARGTGEQLDGVEKQLNTRLLPRAQLVIEARWAEIPANAKNASTAPGSVGVLSSEQAAFVVDSVKQTATAKLIALPKVVTLERRSAEIQVPDENNGDIPGGLKLNVLPLVAADGIGLGAELTVSTAAGTLLVPSPAASLSNPANPGDGKPVAQRGQIPVRALLFDGQTLMVPLGFRKAGAGEGEGTRHSFLLVTLTLIDPAGNRLHTDDQLAALKSATPPQIDW
jgi:hypothetical protein